MLESGYQGKIIKAIEAMGGVVVNGSYTKAGIADLICGYPIFGVKAVNDGIIESRTVLLHLHIEVKTKAAYEKLMQKDITEVNGLYIVSESFKGRERLQAFKLNEVRKKGGLALFAYDVEQVKAYLGETK